MARLKTPIHEQDSFDRARSFLRMCEFMRSMPHELIMPFYAAYVTCAAFTVEAHMKLLAQIERAEPPLDGHDLHSLAHDLSKESFDRIKRRWKMVTAEARAMFRNAPPEFPQHLKMSDDFDLELKRSAKAFIDFRYDLPEKRKDKPPYWSIDGIDSELHQIIVELRPDLADLGGPGTELDPESQLAASEGDNLSRPAGWAILNHKAAALNVKVGRRADPEDSGSN